MHRLLGRLDALGHDRETETTRQVADGLEDRDVDGIRADRVDEGLVDLQRVEADPLEVGETGLAGPEVVQDDADAARAQAVEHLLGDAQIVGDDAALGRLHHQVFGAQAARPGQQLIDEGQQAPVLEVLRDQVDADVDIAARSRERREPLVQVPEDPVGHRHHETRRLGGRDEEVGADQAAFGMAPADQSLGAADAPACDLDDRLQVDLELLGLDRVPELAFQGHAPTEQLPRGEAETGDQHQRTDQEGKHACAPVRKSGRNGCLEREAEGTGLRWRYKLKSASTDHPAAHVERNGHAVVEHDGDPATLRQPRERGLAAQLVDGDIGDRRITLRATVGNHHEVDAGDFLGRRRDQRALARELGLELLLEQEVVVGGCAAGEGPVAPGQQDAADLGVIADDALDLPGEFLRAGRCSVARQQFDDHRQAVGQVVDLADQVDARLTHRVPEATQGIGIEGRRHEDARQEAGACDQKDETNHMALSIGQVHGRNHPRNERTPRPACGRPHHHRPSRRQGLPPSCLLHASRLSSREARCVGRQCSGGRPAPAEAAVLAKRRVRIPADLPEMAVRIGEVAGMAAPGRILGRLHQASTGAFGLGEQRRDLVLGPDVVRQRHAAESRHLRQHLGVLGKLGHGKQRHSDAVEIEGDDLARSTFVGHAPTESLVEGTRPLEIDHAQRHDA